MDEELRSLKEKLEKAHTSSATQERLKKLEDTIAATKVVHASITPPQRWKNHHSFGLGLLVRSEEQIYSPLFHCLTCICTCAHMHNS